ncbi:MAG: biliverdin-producing heme oxygenase [Phycisphaerales bacterium]|nr:biliverdin-producing heme oxygenase [Phycisphaerales bacterium]
MTEHQAPHASQDTFMDRLRVTTASAHATTEEIPFNAAIMSRTLPKDCFAAQVQYWGSLHAALEEAIGRQESGPVAQVWALTGPRAGLLEADLKFLGTPRDCPEAEAVVTDFTAWMNDLAESDPLALLGVLYVFEGSQLGGTILKKPLAEMYDLSDGEGLSYYNVHGPAIRQHWQAFRAGMNDVVTDPADEERLVDSANKTFEMVGRLLTGLSRDLPVSAA